MISITVLEQQHLEEHYTEHKETRSLGLHFDQMQGTVAYGGDIIPWAFSPRASNNHKLNTSQPLLKQLTRKEENGSALQPRRSCVIQV